MLNLSIIVPHYKNILGLQRLIKSIPINEQIEIIIVDDNSCLNEFQKNEIKKFLVERNNTLIFSETNNYGAGYCRNIGLKHATGNYILFADSDDFFTEGFFELLIPFFPSEFDVVLFSPTSMDNHTQQKGFRHVRYSNLVNNFCVNPSIKTELSLRYTFDVPWSKLIKRSFIKKHEISFDEVKASNDVMFSTLIGFYMKDFSTSSKIIYCVTQTKGSLTNTRSEQVFNSRVEVFIRHYIFLKSNLKKQNFKYLNLCGQTLLINSIKNKLGLKKTIDTFLKLQNSRIKIINTHYLNPKNLIKKIKLIKEKEKIYKSYK